MTNDPNWRLPEVPAFTLTSPDFTPGGALPASARASGAGGADRSPALAWEGAPAGTRSYVLTLFDPDAPTSSGWWHWAVVDLPGTLDVAAAGCGQPGCRTPPRRRGDASE